MRFAAALLATALPLLANGQAQLLPAGDFSARDGRPGKGKTWKLNDATGQTLAARLNAIAQTTQISIDYEHQTLLAKTNGQPAPAAGWITSVVWRAGEGLFADVNWTDRAKAHIAANEYRYISPVIVFDEQGHVTGLHNAALVSVPAIVGMQPVLAALSALMTEPLPAKKGPFMDRTQLVAALGLAADATDAQITDTLAALRTAQSRPSIPTPLVAALGLAEGADEAAALAALAKFKAPDATTLATITDLQGKVAALSGQIAERNVTEAVDAAIDARKLLPAQRDWALGLGRADMAQLSAFIKATPVIPGLDGQSHNQDRSGKTGDADPADVARRATAYQVAQLAAGMSVTTAQAVDAVLAGEK